MRSVILGCAALLLWATGAYAQDSGFYLGGGITRTSLDTSSDVFDDVSVSLDDDDNGWKLIAGMRLLDWFAVEGNYVDFGGIDAGDDVLGSEYELTGFDAFAVGFLSAPFVDVFGKVGMIRWDAEGSITLPNFPGTGSTTFSDSDTGTDLAYGAGVQARFGSLAGRLEYERFEVDGTDEVAMLTLGVTYTFL